MKGLHIVQVRGTYYTVELDGVPVTKQTYTYAQAAAAYDIYDKIYQSAWDSAIDWVNEDL